MAILADQPPIRICGNCRFFSSYGSQFGNGECRHHSPVAVPGCTPGSIATRWPETHEGKSCGDHEFDIEKLHSHHKEHHKEPLSS